VCVCVRVRQTPNFRKPCVRLRSIALVLPLPLTLTPCQRICCSRCHDNDELLLSNSNVRIAGEFVEARPADQQASNRGFASSQMQPKFEENETADGFMMTSS
jgi:hypothetical protein